MRHPSTLHDLRSLPPARRVRLLRDAIRARFGEKAVGFRHLPRRKHSRGSASLPILAAIALAASIAVVPAGRAMAQVPHHWHLNVNLASVHTESWARDQLNQNNPGLGAAYRLTRTWGFAGGMYLNSYRRTTTYAIAEWTPVHLGATRGWHVDAGVVGGLASGYSPREVPTEPLMAAAVIRISAPDGIALNILGVPNSGPRSCGFIGLQLAFRL